jgi:hypothetical protein
VPVQECILPLTFLDGFMSVVLSRAEIHVPYGEVVGDNECITLYPRCRTNRSRNNRDQL